MPFQTLRDEKHPYFCKDAHGEYWIGNAGYFLGISKPILTIPPTGHPAHIRFHEFYKCSDGKV